MDTFSTSDATNQTDTTSTIKLGFMDLPETDQATFNRVISFCAARGLQYEVVPSSEADVLITENVANTQVKEGVMLLVVSSDQQCTSGDIQVIRPLLATRIMRIMEQVAKRVTPTPATKSKMDPTQLTSVVKATEGTQQPHTKQEVDTDESQTPISNKDEQLATHQPKPFVSNKSYLALIIDDSAAIRKQLEIELRTSGMRSEFAESGEEALEKIIHQEYDLIFLDIMMPGMDGYETCGRIRKDPRYKKTPVIMLSGKTSPLDEVEGVLAGASTYLTKPVKHQDFQEVIQRITRWLNEFR